MVSYRPNVASCARLQKNCVPVSVLRRTTGGGKNSPACSPMPERSPAIEEVRDSTRMFQSELGQIRFGFLDEPLHAEPLEDLHPGVEAFLGLHQKSLFEQKQTVSQGRSSEFSIVTDLGENLYCPCEGLLGLVYVAVIIVGSDQRARMNSGQSREPNALHHRAGRFPCDGEGRLDVCESLLRVLPLHFEERRVL